MARKRKTPPAGGHGGVYILHYTNIIYFHYSSQGSVGFVPLREPVNRIVERIKRQMLARGELPL